MAKRLLGEQEERSPRSGKGGRSSQALLLLCFLKEQQQSSERSREAMASLEDVSNDDLFAEFLRRMKCATKGEKRIILIGIAAACISSKTTSLPALLLCNTGAD